MSRAEARNGGYGVAVAQKLVELLVRVQLPIVTQILTIQSIPVMHSFVDRHTSSIKIDSMYENPLLPA